MGVCVRFPSRKEHGDSGSFVCEHGLVTRRITCGYRYFINSARLNESSKTRSFRISVPTTYTTSFKSSSFFGIPTYLNRLYLLSENCSRSERRMQYSMQLQPHAVHWHFSEIFLLSHEYLLHILKWYRIRYAVRRDGVMMFVSAVNWILNSIYRRNSMSFF